MPDAVPVLVNRGGGAAARHGERLADAVTAAFERAGLAIALELHDGAKLIDAVRRHIGGPSIVVGGGDGTLNCAAGVLAGGATRLGILPLGTLNHLAGELGVPADLDQAVAIIAAGATRQIDLGSVNDRVFVNNASIGLYPDMVQQRDDSAAPKWLAAVPAAIVAIGRLSHHRLRLTVDGRATTVRTPMLFVGNGRYELALGRVGKRSSLDGGELSIYAVSARGRVGLIGFALRTLFGRADRERDFGLVAEAAALTVTGPRHAVDIALDGEVTSLAMPLEFRSRPGALTVFAPRLSAAPPSPKPSG